MSCPIGWARCLIPGFATLSLAIGLGGCGEDSNSSASPATDASIATSGKAAQPVVNRDLKTFDVCERVPAAEVAVVLDSIPEQTTATATMNTYSTDCTYTVHRDESTRNYAIVFVYAPEWWDASTAGNIEKIDDLGDEAYLKSESLGGFTSVNILVKNDMMLETRAETPRQARELAILALRRLTGADK